MSSDAVKKYAIKIEYYYEDEDGERVFSQGSGVIFKSHEKDQAYYILTAKHIFFPKNKKMTIEYGLFAEELININKDNIFVFIEAYPEDNIIYSDITVRFLANKQVDIGLIILPASETKIEKEVSTIEFFDLDNNNYSSKNFFISGYPRITKNIEQISKLTPYIVQHHQFDESGHTKMLCKSSPVLSMGNIVASMQGISGAGTFIQERDGKLNLSHIQFGVIEPNTFLCTRLDTFTDEINKIITNNHPERYPVSINTKVVIDNESLNFDDFSNLDFFKNKIRNNALAYNKSIKDKFGVELTPSIFDNDFLDGILIQENADKLRKVYKEIEQRSIALSYLYAYLAVIAHKNKSRRTTTALFKRAIDLNPEHEQVFILEKARRTNNFEKIEQTLLVSLEETIDFHESLISMENDLSIKIAKIKNAILDIIKCEGDQALIEQEKEKYLEKLELAYESNHILRDPYKYQELGEFYLSLGYKEKTLYFLHIAFYLLSSYPQTQSNALMMGAIKQQLDEITIDDGIDFESIKESANKKSLQIIKDQEDQNTKRTLEEVSRMLGTVYDDIYHIKLEENKREKTISSLESSLKSLSAKVDLQINQNSSHNLDTILINENISKLDIFNNALNKQLGSIQEKYEIYIDDKTRTELMSIIEEPIETMNSGLSRINAAAHDAENYIKRSEDSLKVLIAHEQEGLLLINKGVQESIDVLSQYQAKLRTDKDEVLEFLKSAELRILDKIHELDLNAKYKNEITNLIHSEINKLHDIVNSATIEQGRNSLDIIESSNNVAKGLNKVITACQELEAKALTEIKRAAIFDYTHDINAIKRSQNRFEKALLDQVSNALLKHKNISIMSLMDFGKKVLLVICFTIVVFITTYFIMHYGLLDLLANLWHTVWQKFNG